MILKVGIQTNFRHRFFSSYLHLSSLNVVHSFEKIIWKQWKALPVWVIYRSDVGRHWFLSAELMTVVAPWLFRGLKTYDVEDFCFVSQISSLFLLNRLIFLLSRTTSNVQIVYSFQLTLPKKHDHWINLVCVCTLLLQIYFIV